MVAAVVASPIPVLPGGTYSLKLTDFGYRWYATIFVDGVQVARVQVGPATGHPTGEALLKLVAPTKVGPHIIVAKTRWRKASTNLIVAIPKPPPPPDEPPIISDIKASPTQTSVVFAFHTSEVTQAYVKFGPTTDYGRETKHEVTFNYQDHGQGAIGLTPGTTYHYRVYVTDSGGNQVISNDQTFSTLGVQPAPTPPPVPPPTPVPTPVPTGPFIAGLDMGPWNVPADAKACTSFVTVPTPNSGGEPSNISSYLNVGLRMAVIRVGPYSSAGVLGINANDWAAKALAMYLAHPEIEAIEVLNEPSGTWFWGSNAHGPGQHAAYARLLRAVWAAFAGLPKRPKILASFDGGYAGSTLWGTQVMAADPQAYNFCDAITMHPYGGNISDRAKSALGNRAGVQAAHQLSGKPVWITEVGWPTATGQPATGDSLQWTEAQQAENITNFYNWARSTGYIQAVTIFAYRDYGSNMWYGITGEGGRRKLSFNAVAAFKN